MPRERLKLTSTEVRNQLFPIEVDTNGYFYSQLDGVEVSAKTYEDLKTKLGQLTATKPARYAVPVTLLLEEERTGRVRHGVWIGRHAANKNHLIRWDGTKASEQFSDNNGRPSSYRGNDLVRRLTDEEVTEWMQLVQAARDAQRACREFVKSRPLNLTNAKPVE